MVETFKVGEKARLNIKSDDVSYFKAHGFKNGDVVILGKAIYENGVVKAYDLNKSCCAYTKELIKIDNPYNCKHHCIECKEKCAFHEAEGDWFK